MKNSVIAAVIFANTFAASEPLIKWSRPVFRLKKLDSINKNHRENENP